MEHTVTLPQRRLPGPGLRAWFTKRVPSGPVRSVLLGVLAAAVVTPTLHLADKWFWPNDTSTPAVDLTLLQFVGSDFDLLDRGSFRTEELELVSSPGQEYGTYLRVTYPEGSSSPTSARVDGTPMGGAQFYLDARGESSDHQFLRYYMRLSPDFDFVRGGLLPGLYGGAATAAADGREGQPGVATRFGWTADGRGEVYTYASASGAESQSLGAGSWSWPVDRWACVEQEVNLGQPGESNGQIRVWLDGEQVWQDDALQLRDTGALDVEGVFFSTFFGGSDATWATPRTQWADFAGVRVDDERVGCSTR